MSAPTSSKVDGEVVFMTGTTTRSVVARYPAIIHLFEHQYDPETAFWYGVAEVACTYHDIDRDSRTAGVLDPGEGLLHNPQEFPLRIELSDGRWGRAADEFPLRDGFDGPALQGCVRL